MNCAQSLSASWWRRRPRSPSSRLRPRPSSRASFRPMPQRAKRPDPSQIKPGSNHTFKENRSMADLQKIVDDLSGLTVLEAAELAKLLEEKWGVSTAAAVAV